MPQLNLSDLLVSAAKTSPEFLALSFERGGKSL